MQSQRDEPTMLNLIVHIAAQDERIRAVIMNGSRVSPSAKKDIFQDYDIVFLVTDVSPFVYDTAWIKQFGDLLILQKPDEMDGLWPKNQDQFAYLMQFKDWNRIDLTLLNISKLATIPRDSQSILLLDKDNLVPAFNPPSDNDYLPTAPTAKQFYDCCNEFWWVSTYVAKGLWRDELIYTKYVAEQIVKEQLIKLLGWYAADKTHYQQSLGKFSKNLQYLLEPHLWQEFIKTYAGTNNQEMWQALFKMCDLFNFIAQDVAKQQGFEYESEEYQGVLSYLKEVHVCHSRSMCHSSAVTCHSREGGNPL